MASFDMNRSEVVSTSPGQERVKFGYPESSGVSSNNASLDVDVTADEIFREDAKSLAPDVTSIEGLTGYQLRMTTERTIAQCMLRRDDASGLSSWRRVVSSQAVDDILLDDFEMMWSRRNEELAGNEIMAMFARFGSPNDKLEEDLLKARASAVNRNYEWNMCWKSYNGKSVHQMFSTGRRAINQHLLYGFLKNLEDDLDIIELQISRSDADIIDRDLVDVPLSASIIRTLFKKIGIVGVDSWQIEPIISNAHRFLKKAAGLLTLLELQTYCVARANMCDSEGKHSTVRRALDSFIKPFSNQEQRHADLFNSAACSEGMSVLYLFSTLPADASGSMKSADLLAAMIATYPAVDESTCKSFCRCISRRRCRIDSDMNMSMSISGDGCDGTIAITVLETFCFPKGFSLIISMPTGIGSFQIKNSKIKPLDNTDKIYALAKKHLFVQLRKLLPAESNRRVPDDLKFYLDKDCVKLVPNSSSIKVVRVMDSNTRLHGRSAYVEDILDTLKLKLKLKQAASTEQVLMSEYDQNTSLAKIGNSSGIRKMKSSRSAQPSKHSNDLETGKTIVPYKGNKSGQKYHDYVSLQESGHLEGTGSGSLDLPPTSTLVLPLAKIMMMPPSPPFSSLEYEAHKWSVCVVLKVRQSLLEMLDTFILLLLFLL